MNLPINQILEGNAEEILKKIEDASVNTCVTSPPYYKLRDYGVEGQIGLEKTPEDYINKLVRVFREVRRILKEDGTLWINIGDSYNGSKKGNSRNSLAQWKSVTKNKNYEKSGCLDYSVVSNLKPKDLMGIPWMLAFALRSDGWYLRQDIIWHKPNVIPESVKDRCTKSHEYIFLLSKSAKYFFDNERIKEPCVSNDKTLRNRNASKLNNTPGRTKMKGLIHNDYQFRNKRDVWVVPPSQFKGAHFAVFPERLIIDCLKAGCPDGGIVIDPFFGSGTTGVVAKKIGQNFIGIELNPSFIELAKNRLNLK